MGDCEVEGNFCCMGAPCFLNTRLGFGIVKSRVIAAVEGEFILNATLSWKLINFFGDRQVEGKCFYIRGSFLIPVWVGELRSRG